MKFLLLVIFACQFLNINSAFCIASSTSKLNENEGTQWQTERISTAQGEKKCTEEQEERSRPNSRPPSRASSVRSESRSEQKCSEEQNVDNQQIQILDDMDQKGKVKIDTRIDMRASAARGVELIGAILKNMIEESDSFQTKFPNIYMGSASPPIDIAAYAKRLHYWTAEWMNLNPSESFSCLVIGLIYLDRFLTNRGEWVQFNSLTAHRLWLHAFALGIKNNCDLIVTHSQIAQLGGTPLAEYNRLEVDFIFGIDWDVHVTPKDFQTYLTALKTRYRDIRGMIEEVERGIL